MLPPLIKGDRGGFCSINVERSACFIKCLKTLVNVLVTGSIQVFNIKVIVSASILPPLIMTPTCPFGDTLRLNKAATPRA
ncbi:MAG: hypothetical protein MUP08_06870, partial [Desulfobulbaceae bacterium]|nr:hypothetical protein [Desulfobulbaceae bacterium]